MIWHYYANRVNLGDWASALGIQQFVNQQAGQMLDYTERFLLDAVPDSDIDAINDSAKVVIVGGGGLWRKTDLPSGWLWNITQEQLARIKVPIVLYGVGLNVELYNAQTWFPSAQSIRLIQQVVEQAALVGVRDEWTRQWALKHGMPKAQLIPCPSMFVEPDSALDTVPVQPMVGINVLGSERLPRPAFSMQVIGNMVRWLQSAGYQPYYISQISVPRDTQTQLQAQYPGESIVPQTVTELLQAYQQTQFVVGMRAHALLLSFNRNKPAFSLSYNHKNDAFMQLLQVAEHQMRWEPRRYTLAPLVSRQLQRKLARFIVDVPTIQNRWEPLRQHYHQLNAQFAQQIVDLL